MKYIVEVTLRPGAKNKLVDAFELRGPNRNPGVKFLGAWVGRQAEVLFILVESESEEHLDSAAQSWGDFGERRVIPVIDIDAY